MLNLVTPKFNETYGIHNPTRSKLLTRLRLALSRLNDLTFNHQGNVLTCFVVQFNW